MATKIKNRSKNGFDFRNNYENLYWFSNLIQWHKPFWLYSLPEQIIFNEHNFEIRITAESITASRVQIDCVPTRSFGTH